IRVFMPSFMRCLRSPWRESSHGMSSGWTTFLRFALRAGAALASSSSAWYSAWFAVPRFQDFDSLHAMVGLLFVVIEIGFGLARREALAARGGHARPRLHLVLEEHVHEHEHGLGLDHQGARGLGRARIEMLVHAIVVDDRDVARLPVVPDAVVHLVALAVEDVERRLVHVAVLLRARARTVVLEMEVESLGDAVLGLDVVAAVGLGAVVELDLGALAHPRHRAQPRELVLQAVLALDRAHEDAVLLAVVVRFVGNRGARLGGCGGVLDGRIHGHLQCEARGPGPRSLETKTFRLGLAARQLLDTQLSALCFFMRPS